VLTLLARLAGGQAPPTIDRPHSTLPLRLAARAMRRPGRTARRGQTRSNRSHRHVDARPVGSPGRGASYSLSTRGGLSKPYQTADRLSPLRSDRPSAARPDGRPSAACWGDRGGVEPCRHCSTIRGVTPLLVPQRGSAAPDARATAALLRFVHLSGEHSVSSRRRRCCAEGRHGERSRGRGVVPICQRSGASPNAGLRRACSPRSQRAGAGGWSGTGSDARRAPRVADVLDEAAR
jgi:hypothetical protein